MRSFCKTASIAIRPCFRMHILKIGIFVGIFTLVTSTPLPSDPHDSDVEILTENPNSVIILSDDSDSDNSVIIIQDDSDSDNSVQILPEDEDHDMEEDPRDQQPNFLPNGVTGHEIISQTPEEIRVYVAAPPIPPMPNAEDQPSTSTGRRGPTLRRSFAHLETCLKRRAPGVDYGIRRNIGK
jgi:hypothetical protein